MISTPVTSDGLREALAVREREVVAFVGAGGKTTAMFRLARELRAGGAAVVVTTTTKILVPPPDDEVELITDETEPDLVAAVAAILARRHVAVVARAIIPGEKLDGIAPERVAALLAAGATHVLVEADGAARRPFKAPRAGEPVIPGSATLVVPVVGVDALGEPLSDDVAHRPERVTALTGLGRGERLTAAAIARVMLGPAGNTRGAPRGARIVPLINKADTPERLAKAHDLARELRRCGAERVAIAALEAERPIMEIWPSR